MHFDKLKADMALYAKGEQQILEIVDIMDEAVRRAYDETGVLPIFLGVYLVELASSLVRIGETHEEWHEFGDQVTTTPSQAHNPLWNVQNRRGIDNHTSMDIVWNAIAGIDLLIQLVQTSQ